MSSLFLSRLSQDQRTALLKELHERQSGSCFICAKPVDLALHKNAIDVDHVIPTSLNGQDNPGNFALTHDSCNRAKQDSDLRVARVIAKFDEINESVEGEGRAANLGDILKTFRNSSFPFPVSINGAQLQ